MTRYIVESLSGIGTIHAGDKLLRTTAYQLSVWSPGQPSAPDSPSDAPSIEGHIDIAGIGEAVVLAGPDALTLTLEDGRRLSIRLTSSGGSIIGRGWLDTAPQ
jgi:hypothetical protein